MLIGYDCLFIGRRVGAAVGGMVFSVRPVARYLRGLRPAGL